MEGPLRCLAALDEGVILIDSEGGVFSSGDNLYCQLGRSTTDSYEGKLQRISNIPPMLAVSCGCYHILSLDENSRAWTWGRGAFGQLGSGTNSDHQSPTLEPLLEGMSALVRERPILWRSHRKAAYWSLGGTDTENSVSTTGKINSLPRLVMSCPRSRIHSAAAETRVPAFCDAASHLRAGKKSPFAIVIHIDKEVRGVHWSNDWKHSDSLHLSRQTFPIPSSFIASSTQAESAWIHQSLVDIDVTWQCTPSRTSDLFVPSGDWQCTPFLLEGGGLVMHLP